MRTQKIGKMVGMALAYNDKVNTTQDVWAAEDVLADYLERAEKDLNDEEWYFFNEMFETMKGLREAASRFTDEAWEGVMYEGKGKLHLFENGHIGSAHDIDAQNMDMLYSIMLDWDNWVDLAVANEDGSKDFDAENGFKAELEEYLYNVVLSDYLEAWLDHIAFIYKQS